MTKSLRCYNARVRFTFEKEQKRRLMVICSKFGMASNEALLVVNFTGWLRVVKVEKTMRKMFNRQSGEWLLQVFQAWSVEGMKESALEKLKSTILVQKLWRGRVARQSVEVIK